MADPLPLTCFKAYDIRGRLGTELNQDIARRIGRAFGEVLEARRVGPQKPAKLPGGNVS